MTRTISVGFSYHSENVVSWMIKKYDNRPFSHVYLKVENELTGNVIVYQASGLNVNAAYYPIFLKKAVVVKEITFNVDTKHCNQTVSFMESKLGMPYSMTQLIGFVYLKLVRKLGFKVKNNPFGKNQEAYVCSEIVTQVLRDVFSMKIDADLDSVSPSDVAQILVDNNLVDKFW